MKKNKLKNLLKALSPDEVLSEKFRNFDQSVDELKKRLTQTIEVNTLDDVRGELKKFQKKIDYQPLLDALKEIEQDFFARTETLTKTIEEHSAKASEAIKSGRAEDHEKHSKEMESLKKDFLRFMGEKEKQIGLFYDDLDSKNAEVKESLASHATQLVQIGEKHDKTASDIRKEYRAGDEEVKEYVDKTKNTLISMFPNRGGSANRQINVNSSVMSSKYTDINFQSDTAIRWVATDDTTNKRVDIRASLISGGASGPGGTPAGNNTEVQFNDGGSFGASSSFAWFKDSSILSANNVEIDSNRAISSVFSINDYRPAYSGADQTVGHKDANYSSVATATFNTSTIGGTTYVGDGTYTEGQIIIRRTGTRLNLSQGTTIQADGSSVDPLVVPSVTGLGRVIIDGGKLLQTNATAQGVGLDMSNMANAWVSKMRIEEFGTGIKMHDSANTTFYNSARDMQLFNVVNGIDLGGTQPNLNLWDNVRIRPKAGQAGTAINMSSVRGNVFLMPNAEPATAASITGIHLDGATRDNLFLGAWVENNEDGVLIDQGADNNVFIGGTITSNTNDIRDSGTNTVYWGVNKTGTKLYKVPKITDTTGKAQVTFTENSGVVRFGQPSSLVGGIQIAGSIVGVVTIQAASTAGGWTMTLPPNDGSANQVLTTDGNGITTWASVAATGGSGITRNVSIITADTTAADSASTDYVYFVEATGIRLTLPTAVANSNLYTVKNHSGSSVLVIAPEGVDGSASALMPTNYESLSFISNSSIWGVI